MVTGAHGSPLATRGLLWYRCAVMKYYISSVVYSLYVLTCRSPFFFFFQAEDGIRDIGVTGVQTCALPISFKKALRWRSGSDRFRTNRLPDDVAEQVVGLGQVDAPGVLGQLVVGDQPAPVQRSEERRVGKECRSRWSPYH